MADATGIPEQATVTQPAAAVAPIATEQPVVAPVQPAAVVAPLQPVVPPVMPTIVPQQPPVVPEKSAIVPLDPGKQVWHLKHGPDETIIEADDELDAIRQWNKGCSPSAIVRTRRDI